jgi:hypothetical protein
VANGFHVVFITCVATVYPLQDIFHENYNFHRILKFTGQKVEVKYKYVETYFIVLKVVGT